MYITECGKYCVVEKGYIHTHTNKKLKNKFRDFSFQVKIAMKKSIDKFEQGFADSIWLFTKKWLLIA